jgi:hypothetical protein
MVAHIRTMENMDPAMLRCIDNCVDCAAICTETVMHCLEMGGEHAAPGHIRLLLDCAEICQTSANFMLRHSELHGRTCGVCAEVCERCAEDCARFTDDAVMQQCAEMCRTCAQSCREMAAHG